MWCNYSPSLDLPPIYGLKTSGILTSSICLKVISRNAISILGGATTVLLRVCAKYLFLFHPEL